MSRVLGGKELSVKLKKLERAAGRKVLRSATLSATLPALNAAKAAAPVGSPPYVYDGHGVSDPYPVRDWKGRLRVPGTTAASVARKSFISRDGTTASAIIGVKPIAFYALQFHELGTSREPAKPWLVPAFEHSRGAMFERLKKRLTQLIEKAARK